MNTIQVFVILLVPVSFVAVGLLLQKYFRYNFNNSTINFMGSKSEIDGAAVSVKIRNVSIDNKNVSTNENCVSVSDIISVSLERQNRVLRFAWRIGSYGYWALILWMSCVALLWLSSESVGFDPFNNDVRKFRYSVLVLSNVTGVLWVWLIPVGLALSIFGYLRERWAILLDTRLGRFTIAVGLVQKDAEQIATLIEAVRKQNDKREYESTVKPQQSIEAGGG